MKAAPAEAKEPEQQFENVMKRKFLLRWHMAFILFGTFFAGLVASRLLHLLGFNVILYRSLASTAVAYLVFFGLVRLWCAILLRSPSPRPGRGPDPSLDGVGNVDFPTGGMGGVDPSIFRGGGGNFGGGGASDSWGVGDIGGGDIDVDGDGILFIVAFAVVVASICGGGAYLIVVAPHILAESAFHVALAAGLLHPSKKLRSDGWLGGVARKTWIPFLLVAITTGVFGWLAQRHCPGAETYAQVFEMCVR